MMNYSKLVFIQGFDPCVCVCDDDDEIKDLVYINQGRRKTK